MRCQIQANFWQQIWGIAPDKVGGEALCIQTGCHITTPS